MAKRKIIASFLFLLLFIFFSNNLPYELRPSYGKGHFSSFTSAPAAKTLAQSDLSFSRHTPKKEHVKVRYMGSQCGFHVSLFRVAARPLVFAEPYKGIPDCFFVSSNGSFLFKLRGPPAADGIILC